MENLETAKTNGVNSTNNVATAIKMIGILTIISGVILFFITISNPEDVYVGMGSFSHLTTKINWMTGFMYLFGGIVSGSITIGFSTLKLSIW